MKLLTNLNYYWKSIIVIAGILYLSFAPPSTFTGVPTFQNEDKLVHVFLYACLTIILIFDFHNYKKLTANKLAFVLYCLIFPIVLGGIVEIFQEYFFPPRTAEWTDWLSDIIGVLAGWLVMYLLKLTPKSTSFKSE